MREGEANLAPFFSAIQVLRTSTPALLGRVGVHELGVQPFGIVNPACRHPSACAGSQKRPVLRPAYTSVGGDLLLKGDYLRAVPSTKQDHIARMGKAGQPSDLLSHPGRICIGSQLLS
jgi:hypothetical protein